ncbi:MAG: hypothetical protein RR599_00515 [Victivallaceae bacterium]
MASFTTNLNVDYSDGTNVLREQASLEKHRADKYCGFGIALIVIGLALSLIVLVIGLTIPGLMSLPGLIVTGVVGLILVVAGMILVIKMYKAGVRAKSQLESLPARPMRATEGEVSFRSELQRGYELLHSIELDFAAYVSQEALLQQRPQFEAMFNNRMVNYYQVMHDLSPDDADTAGMDATEFQRRSTSLKEKMDVLLAVMYPVKILNAFLIEYRTFLSELDILPEMKREMLQFDGLEVINGQIISVLREFCCQDPLLFSVPERITEVNQHLQEVIDSISACITRYQEMSQDQVFGASLVRVLDHRYRTFIQEENDIEGRVHRFADHVEAIDLRDSVRMHLEASTEIEKLKNEAIALGIGLEQETQRINDVELTVFVADMLRSFRNRIASLEVSSKEKEGLLCGVRTIDYRRACCYLEQLNAVQDWQECQNMVENIQAAIGTAVNDNEEARNIFQSRASRIIALFLQDPLSIQDPERRESILNLWRECVPAYTGVMSEEGGSIPCLETNDPDCVLRNIDYMNAIFLERTALLIEMTSVLGELSAAALSYQFMDQGEVTALQDSLGLFRDALGTSITTYRELFRTNKLSFIKYQKESNEEKNLQETATCNIRRALESCDQWGQLLNACASAEQTLSEFRKNGLMRFDMKQQEVLVKALQEATLNLEVFKQGHSDIVDIIQIMKRVFDRSDTREEIADVVAVVNNLQLLWRIYTALFTDRESLIERCSRCHALSVAAQTLRSYSDELIVQRSRLQRECEGIWSSGLLIQERCRSVLSLLMDLGCQNSLGVLEGMSEEVTQTLLRLSINMREHGMPAGQPGEDDNC